MRTAFLVRGTWCGGAIRLAELPTRCSVSVGTIAATQRRPLEQIPRGNGRFPRSLDELEQRFGDELACQEFLNELRWREGFVCPKCQGTKRWMMAEVVSVCARCRRKASLVAGTIIDKTRTPLRHWFRAGWFITTQKLGVSATTLQRILGLRNYQTGWTMFHKFRSAMVRPDRDRLRGNVEVDETFIGGVETKAQGRGRKTTNKQIVVIPVEFTPVDPSYGRVRMEQVPDFTGGTLLGFVDRNVKPGTPEQLPGARSAGVRAPPYEPDPEPVGCRRGHADGPPRRLALQEGVAWHTSGRDGQGAPPGVPERVHLQV